MGTSARLLVVGGGVSGLTLAHQLLRSAPKGTSLQLVESAQHIGGWVKTVHRDGLRFELGPRALSARRCPATLRLMEQLNLEPVPANKLAAVRYIYYEGRCVPLPSNPFDVFSCPLTKHLPREVFSNFFRFRQDENNDPSVYDFVKSQLGELSAELLADPVMAGIFAGDSKRLSMRSCFPGVFAATRRHNGSLTRSMLFGPSVPSKEMPPKRLGPLFSFPNGMTDLPTALAASLKNLGAEISTQTSVSRLSNNVVFDRVTSEWVCSQDCFQASGRVTALVNGEASSYDGVFLTGTGSGSVSLLESFKGGERAASLLRQVKQTSLYAVSVGWKSPISRPQTGFGVLVPSSQAKNAVLGITFDSDSFPVEGEKGVRMTVMIGGDRFPEAVEMNKAAAEDLAVAAVKNMLEIDAVPDIAEAFLARECIPQFYCGHHILQKELENALRPLAPQLSLLSPALTGVSVHECIQSGVDAADTFLHQNKV